MKKLCVTIAFLVTFVSFAQNKDDITVIYYSAKFIPDVDLSDYNDYNLQKFYIDKNPEILSEEKIKYLPTIILYNDGEQILKIESDISLKLKPENWIDILQEHIEELLSQRF
jgi:hypothetical protein|tara:strand:+ start:5462 stop:5797 length:336 start_codon:yes stop_codon:yes gene_type:complete